jgi:hypothetical protein
MAKNDDIKHWLDEYVALADSPRNQKLLHETWSRPNLAYIENVGVPGKGKIPIIADPMLAMWAKKMGIKVGKMYVEPETYLSVWLGREIGRFTQIQDDRPLNKRILVLLGAGFESSLYGAKQVYADDTDPWIDRTPVLQGPEDLDKLQPPDFSTSGLMPLAHRFYNELSELVEGHGLTAVFPNWGRSPFAVAMALCGMQQLLVDMIERPEFVEKLLVFLTQSAIHYRQARAKFLGTALDKPELGNDEVNVPSISPRLYRDLVLPSEKAYASAFGGLVYWHSCGNVTPMLELIREIPNITIFHVGPWTDVARAASIFGDTTLDICLHSMDVYRATEEAMRAKVTTIVQTCWQRGARSFSIRPGILEAFATIDEDLASAARWVGVAKKTVAHLTSEKGQS